MKVMYPGSFDPITLGHLDIIRRASNTFEEVVIALMENPKKETLFTAEERKQFILEVIQTMPNCMVVIGEGLTVDLAQQLKCNALVRGVRTISDLEYEMGQASINRILNQNVETVFLLASDEHANISSSTAKTLAHFGGALDKFVPKHVEIALRNRYGRQLKGESI